MHKLHERKNAVKACKQPLELASLYWQKRQNKKCVNYPLDAVGGLAMHALVLPTGRRCCSSVQPCTPCTSNFAQ